MCVDGASSGWRILEMLRLGLSLSEEQNNMAGYNNATSAQKENRTE